MKKLIEAVMKKWLCCHEWECVSKVNVQDIDEFRHINTYTVLHYFCKKCGKYKRFKSS